MEFRDLKAQYNGLKPEIDSAIKEVISKSNFIMGDKVAQLEQQLADFVGVKHCITCASGTDALLMPLMGWNIGKGDAVFVPDFTFFSTAEVVANLGATPVFVDIDQQTFNMDPVKLEFAVEKVIAEGRLTPKAIIAVDLFGQPADYIHIEKIAEKYRLLLLEDGAQGFGGMLNDKRACSFGDAAATSFFPAKPLGCYGDGGAMFTNDDSLAEYLKSVHIHGKGKNKYDNVRLGLNSRLDTLQAAILLPKLTAFDRYELKQVNHVAEIYNSFLSKYVKVPVIPDGFYSSWAQYCVLFDNHKIREKVSVALKKADIPTNIYYPTPLHAQTVFADLHFSDSDLPVATDTCQRVLALPMHPYLDDKTIKVICDNLLLVLNR